VCFHIPWNMHNKLVCRLISTGTWVRHANPPPIFYYDIFVFTAHVFVDSFHFKIHVNLTYVQEKVIHLLFHLSSTVFKKKFTKLSVNVHTWIGQLKVIRFRCKMYASSTSQIRQISSWLRVQWNRNINILQPMFLHKMNTSSTSWSKTPAR